MGDGTMNVKIQRAALEKKETLKNLMQFYFYDFSEFVEAYVGHDGLFGAYRYLDNYWTEDGRYPYLVEAEGKLAGFVLVREVNEEEKTFWSIAEFFIMKKFRRSGIGKLTAHHIFDQHKGNWEVFQILTNKPAQAFWRMTIDEYTAGKYEERKDEEAVTQLFCNQ
jgi:predicted acetyltransferase